MRDDDGQMERPPDQQGEPLPPSDLRTIVAGRVISGEPLDERRILDILGSIIGDDGGYGVAGGIELLERGAGRSGDFGEAPIDGLGGVVLQVLLDALSLSLDENQKFFQPITIQPKGQILDYWFKEKERTGYLDVVVWYEVTGAQTGVLPTPAYRYKVQVDRTITNGIVQTNGFSVLSSDMTNPSNPFPGTVPVTGRALERVQEGDLEYKLWAEGQDIRILEVWFNPNFTPGDLNGFTLLPTSSPLYKVIQSSCIDMMFQALPPPVLKATDIPPFYCLGRCKNPMLINTQ